MNLFRTPACIALMAIAALLQGCDSRSGPANTTAPDPQLPTRRTIEVTARLTEIPEGAIFKRDLYDYATVLKYEVLTVHRGEAPAKTIFVAHYNPWKPRNQAADQRVQDIGGNLDIFRAGDLHRMALEVPLDDHFMGGVINKYFGQETGPIYWAVWTSRPNS